MKTHRPRNSYEIYVIATIQQLTPEFPHLEWRVSCRVRKNLQVLFLMSAVLLAGRIQAWAGPSCPLNPVNQTVTICTPVNGATGLVSPVHVNAGTTDTHAIVGIWIYVDFVKVFFQGNVTFIDTNVNLTTGQHRFVVEAEDSAGVFFKTVETITVGGSAAITVTPGTVTLQEGAQQQFSANAAVTWSASCGTITSTGLYTAPNQVESCTVTATDASNHQGHATVNVVAKTITVTPMIVTLQEGAQQQFSADATVTWSASCGTITSTGLYTAPNQVESCMVTATDALNNQGTATVNVVALTVTPSTVTLQEGAQQQFSANATVTWSATCGTITATGLYTAPNQAESCTVTATDASNDQGTATVTVVAPGSITGYLTWKNDNARTGQQRNETILTPSNVTPSKFGKKFTDSVDGYLYAQPLYVSNLLIQGATHNVVFAATEHDSVYAFDADAAGAPLWHRSFLSSGVTTVPTANVGSTILPEVGITGTPVIDPSSGTLYVVAETLENGGATYVHRLHALDIATGAERTHSPVTISGSVFTSKTELQRPGLLLENGLVYIGFASQGDHGLWQGYIFAYDAAMLGQAGIWNDVPTGKNGGIWMGGAGLPADASGNIFVSIGNGTWDPANGDYGDSFVKLSSNLTVLDYFTPFDEAQDNAGDLDVGAGGPLVVPDQSGAHPHLLIGCGKPSPVYVIDRDNMGHFHSGSDSQIVQSLKGVGAVSTGGFNPNDHCFMTPAFWEQNVYFIGNHDVIKAYHLDSATGLLSLSPTSKGTFFYAFPGGQPVVSSNGSSNGIVWAVDFNSPPALHAYDATDVSKELYDTNDVSTRDSLGTATKFSVPTVINGKVYVGGKGHLIVYGPL